MHRMEWKIHHECRSDLKGEITMDFPEVNLHQGQMGCSTLSSQE